MTPTAYTYGSVQANARIAISEGMLQYLETDEVNAVIGHELGHIKHYDFILISLMVTISNLIYLSSRVFFEAAETVSSADSKEAGSVAAVFLGLGVVAHLCWIISNFLVLYVSRIREFMADIVGSQTVDSASSMQRALIKVGYGMMDIQNRSYSNDPNCLVHRSQEWDFYISEQPFTDWNTQDESWSTADKAVSKYARMVFDVPNISESVVKVREGWFSSRPPASLAELPELLFDLYQEGVIECELNGQALTIENDQVVIPSALLNETNNVMGVKLDMDVAKDTGSFRLQLAWKKRNVFRNSQKKEIQGLTGVAALNFSSRYPTSSSYVTDDEIPLGDKITTLMLFDIKNPWAKYIEFFSTHPLTGNRLLNLQNVEDVEDKTFLNVEKLHSEIEELDMGRLRGTFYFELFVYFLPTVSFITTLLAGGIMATTPLIVFVPTMMMCTVGLAMILKGLYAYSVGQNFSHVDNVYTLMADPYQNPLRGEPVTIRGHVIGKMDAGSYFGEDMVVMDETGATVYVNYESIVPIFGNLYFGMKKLPPLIGEKVFVRGWFKRGQVGVIDAHDLVFENFQVFCSSTRFWALWGGAVWCSLGLGVLGIVFPPLFLLFAIPFVAIILAYFGNKRREAQFPKQTIQDMLDEQKLVIT